MEKTLVKFWGVRGSMAAPGPGTVRYGGNTPCVEISSGRDVIICDAGTGIRILGRETAKKRGALKATLLLSHLHLDHVIGLPFFKPLYKKGASLVVASPGRSGAKLKADLGRILKPPYFPVDITKAPAALHFREFKNDSIKCGKITVSSFKCNHPDGSYAFKFLLPGKKTLAYISDNEPSGETHRRLVKWLKGADVLIHDAQYTPKQYESKRGWGHSPYFYPVGLAFDAGIKKLVLFHYDPSSTDTDIDRIARSVEKLARRLKIAVTLSREGMKIRI